MCKVLRAVEDSRHGFNGVRGGFEETWPSSRDLGAASKTIFRYKIQHNTARIALTACKVLIYGSIQRAISLTVTDRGRVVIGRSHKYRPRGNPLFSRSFESHPTLAVDAVDTLRVLS